MIVSIHEALIVSEEIKNYLATQGIKLSYEQTETIHNLIGSKDNVVWSEHFNVWVHYQFEYWGFNVQIWAIADNMYFFGAYDLEPALHDDILGGPFDCIELADQIARREIKKYHNSNFQILVASETPNFLCFAETTNPKCC